MNLLYIGTWSVNDPLSRSTIVPHLKVLKCEFNFSKIIYCSLERQSSTSIDLLQDSQLIHDPYFTNNEFGIVENMSTYINYFIHLKKAIGKHHIKLILCRGALAGSLGYNLWKKSKIEFFVESS